jgi:DNA-directed RNA polymerase specialized sigma24 family protein
MNDWDRIVREHGPAVFTTAWRILGDEDAADEVVQEVLGQTVEIACEQDADGLESMLRRQAVSVALEQLRQQPAAAGRDGCLATRLRSALALLPGCEAEVFCLRYFDDLSCEQIAETLLLNRAAVATALLHARACLELLLRPAAEPAEAPGAA